MAKKKKKASSWAQRVGRRMDRRQRARQAVKLAEAGVDPTSIRGYSAGGARRGSAAPLDVSGTVEGPDWQEYIVPVAVLGGLALVLSQRDKGR